MTRRESKILHARSTRLSYWTQQGDIPVVCLLCGETVMSDLTAWTGSIAYEESAGKKGWAGRFRCDVALLMSVHES